MSKKVSKYAQIYEHEWNGNIGRILKSQGPMAAVFYVYIFSNPHRNLSGLYRLPPAYVEADIGILKDDFRSLIESFTALNLVDYDWESDEIFVIDFLVTQVVGLNGKGDKRWIAVESDLTKASSEYLRKKFWSTYKKPVSPNEITDWK